ncbi:MAG: TIGR00266 family protein [Candidatus Methanomethylophilaceae archaeon]|nr:TIGR00266 family protein [Candidatus Methanomethylophilaceae archaeon]
MKYTINGSNLQFVNIQMDSGEVINSRSGAMVFMSGNVSMDTKMEGGFMSGLKRSVSGASMFLVKYRSTGGNGVVALAGNAPGKILDVDLSKGSWICQSSSYLGGEESVKVDLAFQKKLGAGLFGGEGFILQKLSGSGYGFIHACGDLNIIDLKPGETYKVSTSNAVAWEESVKYDIASAGSVKTSIFGGEGFFVTTLTGPGKIVIQSLTLDDLAMAIYPFLPSTGN